VATRVAYVDDGRTDGRATVWRQAKAAGGERTPTACRNRGLGRRRASQNRDVTPGAWLTRTDGRAGGYRQSRRRAAWRLVENNYWFHIHTCIHTYSKICEALRSKIESEAPDGSELNCAKCYYKTRGRMWSLAGIWRMQRISGAEVEFERVPSRWNRHREGSWCKVAINCWFKNWWTEENLVCLVGWWLERISCRYGGNNECLVLKQVAPSWTGLCV